MQLYGAWKESFERTLGTTQFVVWRYKIYLSTILIQKRRKCLQRRDERRYRELRKCWIHNGLFYSLFVDGWVTGVTVAKLYGIRESSFKRCRRVCYKGVRIEYFCFLMSFFQQWGSCRITKKMIFKVFSTYLFIVYVFNRLCETVYVFLSRKMHDVRRCWRS